MEDKYMRDEKTFELDINDLEDVTGGINWGGNRNTPQIDPKIRRINAERREEEAPNMNKSSLTDFFAANKK